MTNPAPLPSIEASRAEAGRVRVEGKFFVLGGRRWYIRGFTYGPFRPSEDETPFPGTEVVRRDFGLIREAGANTVRVFTPPPKRVLDAAGEAGLHVVIGIPWAQHVCFLEDGVPARDARARVSRIAAEYGRHPAVLALLLGNETPPDIVRWERAERVQRFLRELAEVARQGAPETLLSYANFPPTEYLDLDFLDFSSFNVYLHGEADFRRYLARLQNLAGNRPLVLTEIGMDSGGGDDAQARALSRQIDVAFRGGAAGVVVFAFADDWFSLDRDHEDGGFQVRDWSFGVVDTHRRAKPAFAEVRRRFSEPVPPLPSNPPLVSIVVCAFDAERTLRACLQSLRELRYPSYEVIVIDDGSTDRTSEIAESFVDSTTRVIHQTNRGLGAARNCGVREARGEIVAFTDADCVVDAGWLSYLVGTLHVGFLAVGGPNLSPREPGLVPSVVGVAPGGPTHVLLDDDVAEHVPGCNMAFARSALIGIGGFREVYRVAGDDVDVCWRLQDAGHTIGFSPAAVVWHVRRQTVGAYLRQQRGYGRAEARLYFDHPIRFNALGESRWLGRIYGGLLASLFSNRPRIYRGVFGEGLFQTLYEQPVSVLRYLPLTLEWNVVALLLLTTGVASGDLVLLSASPLLVSLASAAAVAARAPLPVEFRGWRGRGLLASLVYLGPLVRGFERTRARVGGAGAPEPWPATPAAQVARSWHLAEMRLTYWSTSGTTKAAFLGAFTRFLEQRPFRVAIDSGWNEWDVEISRGPWTQARIEVAVEDHGGAKRLLRVRASLHPVRVALTAIGACGVSAAAGTMSGVPGFTGIGAFLGVVAAAAVVAQNLRLGRLVAGVARTVADELGLTPVSPGRRWSPRR